MYAEELKKYKLVKIQQLERKEQPQGKQMSSETIIRDLEKEEIPYGDKPIKQPGECYCFMDSGLKERLNQGSNQLFMSFLMAYNHHGDILLVPDDIWMTILFFFTKYVNENAGALRSKFVSHEGQKELIIFQEATTVEQSLQKQKEWDYFFEEIIKEIQKNTKEGVVQELACNFSTTNKLYQVMSTASIMSSFKQYFTYTCSVGCCGINNVYFDGTRDDWVQIRQKLQSLRQYESKYDLNKVLKNYVDHMGKIIDNFIKSYDGQADREWWNRVIGTEEMMEMSGQAGGTYIQGWILHFFGFYYRTHIDDIPNLKITVPIKLVNNITGVTKQMSLKADFVSVSKVDETTYKPDLGLCIIKESESSML